MPDDDLTGDHMRVESLAEHRTGSLPAMRRSPQMRSRWVLVPLIANLAFTGVSTAEDRRRGDPIGPSGIISPVNLSPQEEWPLTIETSRFVCDGDAVYLQNGSTTYPLNGTAVAASRTGTRPTQPLETIWRADEAYMKRLEDSGVPADYVIRINIRPVLDRGVKWCGKGPREPVTISSTPSPMELEAIKEQFKRSELFAEKGRKCLELPKDAAIRCMDALHGDAPGRE